ALSIEFSVMIGACAVAIVVAPSALMSSHLAANFLGSTIVSHGDSALYMNIAMPSAANAGSSSAKLLTGAPGIGVANASTPQYTPVDWSKRPRVVGESHTGGRIARNVRSPASKLSPSLTQRTLVNGNSNGLLCRSSIAQLHTMVAFGHASITSSRLPVWSTSSCDKYTHLTSAGSTRLNASSRNCLRFAIVFVSRMIGSLPLITI